MTKSTLHLLGGISSPLPPSFHRAAHARTINLGGFVQGLVREVHAHACMVSVAERQASMAWDTDRDTCMDPWELSASALCAAAPPSVHIHSRLATSLETTEANAARKPLRYVPVRLRTADALGTSIWCIETPPNSITCTVSHALAEFLNSIRRPTSPRGLVIVSAEACPPSSRVHTPVQVGLEGHWTCLARRRHRQAGRKQK